MLSEEKKAVEEAEKEKRELEEKLRQEREAEEGARRKAEIKEKGDESTVESEDKPKLEEAVVAVF